MKMSFAGRPVLSAVVCGVLLASVGFSYSLATSGTADNSGSHVAMRAAGTVRFPLQFTNAFVTGSTDRDLGDAAIGSAITRHVAARGGFPPRRFTSDRTNTEFAGNVTLSEAINTLPAQFSPGQSTAILYLDGILKGQVGGPFTGAAAPTPVRFDVTVTDSRGTNPNSVTETFRLTMVDSTTFKFAQSALHDGVAFRQYHEKIELIAGNAPYAFSASQISVTDANGVNTPYTSLEDIGLFLNAKNGRLVGRPLFAGTVTFTVDCADSMGVKAKSRDLSTTGQVLSFNVAANPRVASELFATAISIKGDIAAGGKDSIHYSGLVDLTGTTLSKLAGSDVSLQIGNYTSPTVKLDAKGKGKTDKGAAGATMSVSLTADGLLKITIGNDNFGNAGTIIKDAELQKTLKILPVEVSIGDSYDSSELLKFGVKAKGGKFALDYKFGPGNLGGGFLITSVVGKDDATASKAADSWKVAFVALPQENQKFDTAISSTVGIGTDFTDTIGVTSFGGKVKSTDKRDPKAAQVLKLAMSSNGKGGLTTGPLPQKSTQSNVATDIPAALSSTKKARFPLLITLNNASDKEVFGAEGSRVIFPKGSSWISKNLTK